ncbi:hypothetical protein EV363DRAFT_1164129 [Boletus edulis]|nr:hypothetical protein EV363DRAFT_1164129 [Boletus edulis]
MEVSELDTRVEQLRGGFPREDVLAFYKKVVQLRRATFSDSCLHLPCITFTVTKLGIQDTSGNQGLLYNALVPSLGKVPVGFRTADAITLAKPRKLVFVHPWLRSLRDRLDESLSDDEADIESNPASEDPEVDGNSDGDSDASSASTPPLHAEPIAQVDRYTQALQLIACLGRPFNALLLERQSNGQYKRIAAEREIIIPGVPYQTNPKNIRVRVLEIV